MKRPNSRSRTMSFGIAGLALGAITTTSVYAASIGPEGIGITGVNDATITDLGTPRANAGGAGNVNDANLATRVDTYFRVIRL